MVVNTMADELPRGDSQSKNIPIEETVKPPLCYHVSRFKKAPTEEDDTWKLVARYIGPSGWPNLY